MEKGGYAPGRTHPVDRARGQAAALPAAVATPRQSCPDHPMVRMETPPSGPGQTVSLHDTLSETFTTSATVILGRGCLNWGFLGNLGDDGGRWQVFWPQKARESQKVWRFGRDVPVCATCIGAAGALGVAGCAKRVRVRFVCVVGDWRGACGAQSYAPWWRRRDDVAGALVSAGWS